MKKGICLWLVCMLLGMMILPAGAAEEELHFSTAEELLAYLQAQEANSPTQIEFGCDSDLYASLSQNSFYGLHRILLTAGIDVYRSNIRYSDSYMFFRIGYPEYTHLPWIECETTEELEYKIRELIASSEEESFFLLCPPQFLEGLVASRELKYYTALAGVDFCIQNSVGDCLIQFTRISKFRKPYAQVKDYAQFAAAVAGFAEENIDDFYIVFEPELNKKLGEDPSEWIVMLGGSKIDDYSASVDSGNFSAHFSFVTYSDRPKMVCRSVESVKEAIQGMGAAGISDFELIFPNTAVYEELAENEFGRLHEIEAEAGMTGAKMSYSSNGTKIIFEQAVISAEVVALSSLEDAIAYTEECVWKGNGDIHLFCTPELYESLLGDLAAKGMNFFQSGTNRIYDLLSQAGVNDYEMTVSEATHAISIHISSLFPGTAIMRAVKEGNSDGLSPRERETMEAAVQIAEEAKADDPLLTAKNIHDWLCDHVVYTVDETTDEDDNAIGAVLNGKANCDGYTDAFYLIGSLAGLNVRYQHGDSYNKGLLQFSSIPITHIWNLLEIGGEWRMVDVTWDDEEDGCTYIWFNAGSDIAKRLHIWNEDMTKVLADSTVRAYSGKNEFYLQEEADMDRALSEIKERKPATVHLVFDNLQLAGQAESLRDQIAQLSSTRVITYSWEERLGKLSLYKLEWE